MESIKRRVVVLIPARNEGKSIGNTIKSVHCQNYPVDEIVVVANNCDTDDKTADIAKNMGATVYEMFKNKHMKAGALNYALEKIIPNLKDEDCILVMDADTELSPNLIEKCIFRLNEDSEIGAVGSIFVGRETNSLLGWLQKMEFWRYKRQIHRNGNKAFVLSGTASVFLVKTLKAVKDARNKKLLPFGGGGYYDVVGLTEDNEITLSILSLDYKCLTADVTSMTDVMETIPSLRKQRERWYKGALVNLKSFGIKLPWHLKWTYWTQQLGLFFSLIITIMLYLVWGFLLINYGGIEITWWWLIPLTILAMERTISVWQLGWKARLLAVSVIPEQIYSILLLLFYGIGLINFIFGRKGQWHQT